MESSLSATMHGTFTRLPCRETFVEGGRALRIGCLLAGFLAGVLIGAVFGQQTALAHEIARLFSPWATTSAFVRRVRGGCHAAIDGLHRQTWRFNMQNFFATKRGPIFHVKHERANPSPQTGTADPTIGLGTVRYNNAPIYAQYCKMFLADNQPRAPFCDSLPVR